MADTDPRDLSPLYESIDPDALDRLFRGRTGTPDRPETVPSFAVQGRNVFVRGDGRIRVCDPNGSGDPSPIFD